MGVITDEEINTQIRLRAVRTVNAFTTLNNKMAARVLKYLELNKLLKLLYSCDSRGCTDIISLLTNWCTWEKSDQNLHHLINDISNIHKIRMTRPGLEAFMSFIANQSIIDKEEMFKLLYETFYIRISKEAILKLQSLKHDSKYLSVDWYRSDQINTDVNLDDPDHKINQGKVSIQQKLWQFKNRLPFRAKCYWDERSKVYLIDLESIVSVREIKLVFDQTKSKPFNFNVSVSGYLGTTEVVLFTKYINEHLYSYFTFNSYLKEYGLYDPDEEREALYINLHGYVGRYIQIYLNFMDSFATLNGSHQVVETILPEVIGEIKQKLENDETSKVDETGEEWSEEQLIVGHSSPFKLRKSSQHPFTILVCWPESITYPQLEKETNIGDSKKFIITQSKKFKVINII